MEQNPSVTCCLGNCCIRVRLQLRLLFDHHHSSAIYRGHHGSGYRRGLCLQFTFAFTFHLKFSINRKMGSRSTVFFSCLRRPNLLMISAFHTFTRAKEREKKVFFPASKSELILLQTGVYTTVPQLTHFAVCVLCPFVADCFLRQGARVVVVRKIMQSIGKKISWYIWLERKGLWQK